MLLGIILIIGLLFALTVFRGAPYVPTHRRQVEAALDLLALKPGQVLVDLGSGDGVLLKAAAERGIVAHGYEINPILCIVAWIRCLKYRHLVRIHWRDFWLSSLPPKTDAIFTFLAKIYMNKLDHKLTHEAERLDKEVTLISYGFAISNRRIIKQQGPFYIYRY